MILSTWFCLALSLQVQLEEMTVLKQAVGLVAGAGAFQEEWVLVRNPVVWHFIVCKVCMYVSYGRVIAKWP